MRKSIYGLLILLLAACGAANGDQTDGKNNATEAPQTVIIYWLFAEEESFLSSAFTCGAETTYLTSITTEVNRVPNILQDAETALNTLFNDDGERVPTVVDIDEDDSEANDDASEAGDTTVEEIVTSYTNPWYGREMRVDSVLIDDDVIEVTLNQVPEFDDDCTRAQALAQLLQTVFSNPDLNHARLLAGETNLQTIFSPNAGTEDGLYSREMVPMSD